MSVVPMIAVSVVHRCELRQPRPLCPSPPARNPPPSPTLPQSHVTHLGGGAVGGASLVVGTPAGILRKVACLFSRTRVLFSGRQAGREGVGLGVAGLQLGGEGIARRWVSGEGSRRGSVGTVSGSPREGGTRMMADGE